MWFYYRSITVQDIQSLQFVNCTSIILIWFCQLILWLLQTEITIDNKYK